MPPHHKVTTLTDTLEMTRSRVSAPTQEVGRLLILTHQPGASSSVRSFTALSTRFSLSQHNDWRIEHWKAVKIALHILYLVVVSLRVIDRVPPKFATVLHPSMCVHCSGMGRNVCCKSPGFALCPERAVNSWSRRPKDMYTSCLKIGRSILNALSCCNCTNLSYT
jgi:hypothetical protein